jgi:hypothetical protein
MQDVRLFALNLANLTSVGSDKMMQFAKEQGLLTNAYGAGSGGGTEEKNKALPGPASVPMLKEPEE